MSEIGKGTDKMTEILFIEISPSTLGGSDTLDDINVLPIILQIEKYSKEIDVSDKKYHRILFEINCKSESYTAMVSLREAIALSGLLPASYILRAEGPVLYMASRFPIRTASAEAKFIMPRIAYDIKIPVSLAMGFDTINAKEKAIMTIASKQSQLTNEAAEIRKVISKGCKSGECYLEKLWDMPEFGPGTAEGYGLIQSIHLSCGDMIRSKFEKINTDWRLIDDEGKVLDQKSAVEKMAT